jgi:hypothetical protein
MSVASVSITLLEIMPKIFQVVRSVEAATIANQEENPTGSQKLNFALALLETYYETTNPKVPFNDLKAAITKIISAVVFFYNDVKWFKSRNKAAKTAQVLEATPS